jgi:hypothetical protein
MRTDSENHIRIDFGIIDLGVHAAMGDRTLWVYTVLRRYIWRSKTKGASYLRKAFAEGKLVAKVSQGTIAQHLGLSRDTINKAIQVLEESAWIEKMKVPTREGDELIYVLGEVLTQKGGYSEVFTADALCWQLMREVQAEATERGFEGIAQIPLKERISTTKRYFSRSKGKPIDVPCLKNRQGVSEKPTGGVKKTDRGVSEKPTHNKELSIENEHREEEIHNPSGCEARKGPKGENRGAQSHSPDLGESSLRSETPAVTQRVTDASDGVPDHVVADTDMPVSVKVKLTAEEKAQQKAARDERLREQMAEAKRKGDKARGEKLRRREAKDQKILNLGGKGAAKDKSFGKLVTRLESAWRAAFTQHFPDTPLAAWSGREVGQVGQLVEKYNGEIAKEGLLYVAKNWTVISERFKKAPQVPTPGWLLSLHDSLIPEASKFGKVVGVLEEWNSWWAENPKKRPPQELKKRFEAHRKELESLGLI